MTTATANPGKAMIQKIITESNVVNWLDLPVADTDRAKRFYETIFDIEMQTQYFEEIKTEMTFFAPAPGVAEATPGKVSAALPQSGHAKAPADGAIVYINANPDIQIVIDKIESAGGKIVMPKTKMGVAYVALFSDTEGNTLGLHSLE